MAIVTHRIPFMTLAALALGGLLWWAFSGKPDPRQLALGEWREAAGRLSVEVAPETASWRGMGRGKIAYNWLQTDKEPYRVHFVYHGQDIEANVSFDGKDTAILEPEVWDMIPSVAQQQIKDVNRSRNRPERELRLVFRRIKGQSED